MPLKKPYSIVFIHPLLHKYQSDFVTQTLQNQNQLVQYSFKCCNMHPSTAVNSFSTTCYTFLARTTEGMNPWIYKLQQPLLRLPNVHLRQWKTTQNYLTTSCLNVQQFHTGEHWMKPSNNMSILDMQQFLSLFQSSSSSPLLFYSCFRSRQKQQSNPQLGNQTLCHPLLTKKSQV